MINAIVVIVISTILAKVAAKNADVEWLEVSRTTPIAIQSLDFVRAKKMSKEGNVRSMLN